METTNATNAGQYMLLSATRLFPGRWATAAIMLCLVSGEAIAAESACTDTASAAFTACRHEVLDDFWIAIGNCNNTANPQARTRCTGNAIAAANEERETCYEQRAERLNICRVLGEAPYNPKIDPTKFVDPAEIGQSIPPNPYFPLVRGRVWVYKGTTETITVTVTPATRKIQGVTCAVVRDVVRDNGVMIEDTKDWYAQDIYGNVWYLGEIAKNFEGGELVDVEGSWTAGLDSAKAGIIMKAAPLADKMYRQEFSLGNAEDLAKVLSLQGSADVPAASCAGDCLVTKDFTPIEPGVFEHKYYAPGVGPILITNPDTGERVELVEVKN